MNGTITMPDGTELPLAAVSLTMSKGQTSGTCRITPTIGVYARQHAREEGQLKLADGRQARIRLGGSARALPEAIRNPQKSSIFNSLKAGTDSAAVKA